MSYCKADMNGPFVTPHDYFQDIADDTRVTGFYAKM